MTSTCSTCLFEFKNSRCLRQHQCLIRLSDENPDLIVRDEQDLRLLIDQENVVFTPNFPTRFFQFCERTKTAVPGLYPLYFPAAKRNSYPILTEIGNDNSSYELLKKAANEGPVKIRKCVRIQYRSQVLLIPAELLVPHSDKQLKGYAVSYVTDNLLVAKSRKRKCQVGQSVNLLNIFKKCNYPRIKS